MTSTLPTVGLGSESILLFSNDFSKDGDKGGWKNNFHASLNPTLKVEDGCLTIGGGTGYRGIIRPFGNTDEEQRLNVGEKLKLSFRLRQNSKMGMPLVWGLLRDQNAETPRSLRASDGFFSLVVIQGSHSKLSIKQAKSNKEPKSLAASEVGMDTEKDVWYSVEFSVSRVSEERLYVESRFESEIVSCTLDQGVADLCNFGIVYIGTGNEFAPYYSISDVVLTRLRGAANK